MENDNTIYGAIEGQDARILADHARRIMPDDKVLVHVALDDNRLATLKELLNFFAPDVAVIECPAWDCLPYDRVSPNTEIVAKRVSAFAHLLKWQSESKRYPRILLTTINAITQRVMPQSALKNASFIAEKGGTVELESLQNFLTQNGYTRTETVREAGEYAMRGGIIDIFPAGDEEPVRIDLFDDEVESIRAFDPLTQVTHKDVDNFTLQPVTEYFLDEDSIARFRKGYREHFGTITNDPLYEAISEGRRYNGMEHWLPLFYEDMDTLLDYAGDHDLTLDHHTRRAQTERLDQIKDFFESRKTLMASQTQKKSQDVSLSGSVYRPLPFDALYLRDSQWETAITTAQFFSPFAAPGDDTPDTKKARDFADIRALPDGDVMEELKLHLSSLRAQRSNPAPELTEKAGDGLLRRDAPRNDRKVIIAAYSEGSLQRLKAMMEGADIANIHVIQDPAQLKNLKPFEIGLTVLALDHGFTAPDLAVLTEADILGDRLSRKAAKRKKADNFLREVSALDEGDLVTHIDHGIGKFLELETVTIGKVHHDCLKIEYAGGDKLFVPVENIDVLSRFGSDEGTTQLDKLGGAGWQARKARVKKDLMAMADGLLKIAAARTLKKSDPIAIEPEKYNAFAAKFPYAETEDQDRAIRDTLDSMAGTHPMDRLVCGDVGFGKTEVAIRAAYVAAMDGYQVAIVAPTTLLARQHYQNFIKRFEGSGLRIDQLSRMVTAKDATATKDGLKDGSVNIVIGTHALFGKGINFNNLGLLIVDEEQRFGVKQKERIKELKANIHILTLTATPIPRTLQMSLTGVKEMSLITTPPVDRLAVRTFVMPVDMMVIREALLREHYRGGQSFYVCPRIKDMPELEEMLKEHIPEIKVITAHGQMPPADLEDRMTAFYDGQYDVLLATNIIESGIDIPSANTMIVHRADMFGLAQLYQIRGRIGRSKVRAYAYLTYPPKGILNPQAQKRLEVMETLDTLGSGFQLASHDMDIRGAGNLLGDQQSGHIKEIGVELYQQMLEEAVAMAREGVSIDDMPETADWSPTINIGTSVLIPESYVPDLGVRMSLYRRIADLIEADDIENFAAELIDRFGDLPGEVQNLLDIVSIKQTCKRAGIASIEAGPKGALIAFHNDTPPNIESLMHWMTSKAGTVKLRPDQKLSIIKVGWDNLSTRTKGVKNLVSELANL